MHTCRGFSSVSQSVPALVDTGSANSAPRLHKELPRGFKLHHLWPQPLTVHSLNCPNCHSCCSIDDVLRVFRSNVCRRCYVRKRLLSACCTWWASLGLDAVHVSALRFRGRRFLYPRCRLAAQLQISFRFGMIVADKTVLHWLNCE